MQPKEIVDRFRENSRGFVRHFRVPLVLTAVACLLDLFSTMRFMLVDGAVEEAHPVVRLVSEWLGPIFGPLVGKLCQFAAVVVMTIYFRRQASYLFLVVIIMYTWAAWYNVWGRDLYEPRILKWLPL